MPIAKRTLQSGSIRFQASFRIAGRPSISQTFDSRAEARKWLSAQKRFSPPKLLAALDEIVSDGTLCQDINTVGEALRHYGEIVTPTKGGAKQELRRIRQLCRLPFAAMRLESLRASQLDKYVNTRLSDGASGSTLRKELSLLSAVYQRVIKKDGREELRNPVLNTDRPSIAPARERRMSAEEETAIREAFGAHSNKYLLPAFLLAFETGLRRSELLRLSYENCDLPGQTAVVLQSRKGRHPESVSPTREIVLSKQAIQIIESIGEMIRVGKVIKTTAAAIECAWKKIKKKAGIADLCWHDMRHECASRMAVQRVPQAMIQQQLGHMSWNQTRKYQKFTAAEMVNAIVLATQEDQKPTPTNSDANQQALHPAVGVDELKKLFAQFCNEHLARLNHA